MESDLKHITASTTWAPSKSAKRTYGKFHSVPPPSLNLYPPSLLLHAEAKILSTSSLNFFFISSVLKRVYISLSADFPLRRGPIGNYYAN